MTERFKLGDLVWATMRGFSPWPGRVSNPIKDLRKPKNSKKIYCIYFFGTKSYGWIDEDNIIPYKKNDDIYLKYCKFESFKDACLNIEKFIADGEEFEDEIDSDSHSDKLKEQRNTLIEENTAKMKTKEETLKMKRGSIDSSEGCPAKKQRTNSNASISNNQFDSLSSALNHSTPLNQPTNITRASSPVPAATIVSSATVDGLITETGTTITIASRKYEQKQQESVRNGQINDSPSPDREYESLERELKSQEDQLRELENAESSDKFSLSVEDDEEFDTMARQFNGCLSEADDVHAEDNSKLFPSFVLQPQQQDRLQSTSAPVISLSPLGTTQSVSKSACLSSDSNKYNVSSKNAAANDQSNSTIKARPPSRAKRLRFSLSDEQNWAGDAATITTRSNSAIGSKKLNRSKEESQETSKKSQKVEQGGSSQSIPKKIETLSMLPNTWCRTKVATVTYTFKWTVKNFTLFTCKLGEALSSANFKIPQFANLECKLLLYPNGHGKNCKKNICVTLECLAQDNLDIKCELMLLDSLGTQVASNIKIQPCSKMFTNSKSMSYSVEKSKLIPLLENDVLVILCSLSINDCIHKTNIDNEYRAQELQNQLEVLSDLYKSTKEKNFCNIVLNVENREYFAHKSVLAARSTFFLTIFNHFKGRNIHKLNIDNITSSVIEEILSFVYTGKILNMNKLACKLLAAADKFNLSDLKAMCERYLIENLSLNNVLRNLILAEKFGASNLKQKAKNFIVAFSGQIANFEYFKFLRFDLYQEILCLILDDSNT